MARCLITGCEGFAGSHLAELLVGRGHQVYGMVYGDAANIAHLDGRVTMLRCDLRDRESVERAVTRAEPDEVFHLAAQSFVIVSWSRPDETLDTNVLGSFYLLEALRRSRPNTRVVVVGSSGVYGPRSPGDMALCEEHDFRPTSIYAVSKVSEEMLGYFYWHAHGMRVVRVRPFNMTGPRKTDDACSDFSKGIAEVETGRRRFLEVGNLKAVRDFTDGRDAVRALALLAERGEPGQVYNLCSGQGRSIKEVLDYLIGLARVPVTYEVVSERMRLIDDPIYIGDNSKLRGLGWTPTISFTQTLADTLEYWRRRIRESAA